MLFTRKKLVIDWHNYGYTLIELGSSGRGGLLTRIYRLLEQDLASRYFGSSKVEHLCVSRALQNDLHLYSIEATVFYDRPPDEFRRTNAITAHELLTRLSVEFPELRDQDGSVRRTRLTELLALPVDRSPGPKKVSKPNLRPRWRKDRPALIVSSCSWTPDDDFSMILDALDEYNSVVVDLQLPPVLFAVTGRGPLRDFYAHEIRKRKWNHVQVIMPWLEWRDYPVFLGCADIGVSLHNSSSGLDLPMKVVDLLGVGVPVIALTYPTLHELLPDQQLGSHFRTAKQLANQLCTMLKPSEHSPCDQTMLLEDDDSDDDTRGRFSAVGSSQLLNYYRFRIREYTNDTMRGKAYWDKVALPVFEKVLS